MEDRSLSTERWFTVPELAEEWRCSEQHVRDLINSGDLGFVDASTKQAIRRKLRIPASEARRFEATRFVESRRTA